MLLGIISGIFITRILGPDGKGIYAVFQANLDFLTFFLGLSIGNGIIYFSSSKKLSPEKLAGMSVYFLAVICLVLAVFFLLVMGSRFKEVFMPEHYDSLFYVVYLCLAFLVSTINTILSSLIQGYKLFKIINAIALINSVLNVVCFPGLFFLIKIYHIHIEVKEILILSLVILIVNTIITYYFYKRKVDLKVDLNINYKEVVSPFFRYILVVYIGILVNFFNYRLDIWVLMNCSKDMKSVGYYSLAVSIAQMLWLISNPFVNVLLPYLAESNSSIRITRTFMYSRVNISILIIASIILFFAGRYLIPMVYGSAFKEAVYPFEILLVGLFFSSATKPLGVFFAAEDRFIINTYSNLIGLIFTIIFCFWLIPVYGIVGACVATNASYISMFIFTLGMFLIRAKGYNKNWFLLKKEDIKEFGIMERFGLMKEKKTLK